jgi:hypothetical protein
MRAGALTQGRPTAPDWAAGAPLLVEIRSGINDAALVATLCGACGVELRADQTDIPRATVVDDFLEADGRLQEQLMGAAVLRLTVKQCACGASLPGPRVRSRIEVSD